MSGNWLLIDVNLPEQFEVLTVAELSGAGHIDVVIGRIVLFWRWVERHSTCATMHGANIHTVVRLCGGDEAFWRAVESVGWVQFTDEAVVVPDWQKRFGRSAKTRIMAAERAKRSRRSRAGSSKGKSRGPKPKSGKAPETSADLSIPASIDTPEVRAAVDEWLAYKRTNGETYKRSSYLETLLKDFARDPPEVFLAAVRNSIGNNYSGIFRVKKHEERLLFDGAGARAGYDPHARGDI